MENSTLTLAEQIAAARAGRDTGSSATVQVQAGESLKTKSGSGTSGESC